MKKNPFIYGLFVLSILILFSSCNGLNTLTMSVTEPAPVTLPSEVKTIGIIDRSLVAEKNEMLDGIDKILSAEGKNLDKNGAARLIQGIYDELTKNERFFKIKIIKDPNLRSAGMGVFPAALSWQDIDKLCADNEVDAIFSLSFYDTDALIDFKLVPVEVTGPLGISATVMEQHLTIRTIIKTGWRIYDPANKIIWDEFSINEEVISSGKGINPMKAYETVVGRKEAVMQISSNIGQAYALRILPYRIRVNRYYYVGGSPNFKIAKRRAQTGDWHGAAELWEQELTNPKRKIAGRACYNMAIINEIDGNLVDAADWASKSYTDYKNKKALRYLNILKYRIQQNERLKQQTQ